MKTYTVLAAKVSPNHKVQYISSGVSKIYYDPNLRDGYGAFEKDMLVKAKLTH